MPEVATTAEWWSVFDRAGVERSLQTYAFNISSWGGDRQAPPPMRGDDVVIGYQPGEEWVAKMPGARVLSLGMWVTGANDDGTVPADKALEFRENWAMLRRLLWNRQERFTLRKRFYDEGGTLRTADAQAEFQGGLNPEMHGISAAAFTVDLKLADPFFYSSAQTISLNTAASGGVWSGTVLGDWYARKVSLTATASNDVSSPSLTVDTMTPVASWSVLADVPTGKQFTMDVLSQSCRVDGVNAGGLVSRFGSRDWLRLNPGACQITASALVGAWTGTLTYYPAWV